jgi:hypothetical protein
VQYRPRNSAGWEALIRCLYEGGYFEEAEKQSQVALASTGGKPLFFFYQSAILFALGKSKEGLLVLESAMEKAPRLLKKMMDLNPAILQHQQVVDIVARFKRNKSI